MNTSGRNIAGLPWLAAIAFFMQSLDNTILNTAIPTIAESLNCTPLAMRAAIVSYALTVAMLIPISGWLADRFGTKKIFIFAVSLFTLGSLLCALSGNLTFLVISRIIQGIGGAMMMPVSRLAILRAYPRNELLGILNFIAIPGLVGPVLGPLLGGWMVTYVTWHWIFLINLPIGLIGIFYARHFMPDFVMPKRRFDVSGFILFSFSLVLMSVGIGLVAESEIPFYISISTLIGGFILLCLYVLHAKVSTQPLIRLSLFNSRIFTTGIVGCIISRLGISCIPFLMPLMLQTGFGYSPLESGMMMVPMAIGSLTAKSTVAKVLSWFGYRKTLIIVTLSLGIMISLFSLQTPNLPLWLFIIPLFFNGVLMSTQFTSLNTLTLGSLNNDHASEGNSVMAVTQQLSISFGIGISAAVYSLYSFIPVGKDTIDYFHYTFVTMGSITLVSCLIFTFLKSHDGDQLLNKHKKRR
jgi:EmrB/QacA subfamily drug resistance transporter